MSKELLGSKDEIVRLLSEFNRIGTTLPVWAIRLVNGLHYELRGAQAELDGWRDGIEAAKNEYAALILRSNHKIESLQKDAIEARSADDEVVRLRADLKNTSRDYSELRESYDNLFDEHQRLKESLSQDVHGYHHVNCVKVVHAGSGHLHGPDDDSPYDVDGCKYCGRCHIAL